LFEVAYQPLHGALTLIVLTGALQATPLHGTAVQRRGISSQKSVLCELLFDLNSRTTRAIISGPKSKSPLPVKEGVIELNGVSK
jgi:hypothetical protein